MVAVLIGSSNYVLASQADVVLGDESAAVLVDHAKGYENKAIVTFEQVQKVLGACNRYKVVEKSRGNWPIDWYLLVEKQKKLELFLDAYEVFADEAAKKQDSILCDCCHKIYCPRIYNTLLQSNITIQGAYRGLVTAFLHCGSEPVDLLADTLPWDKEWQELQREKPRGSSRWYK